MAKVMRLTKRRAQDFSKGHALKQQAALPSRARLPHFLVRSVSSRGLLSVPSLPTLDASSK